MEDPPGDPNTINKLSFFSIIVGVMELNILLFGEMALASPPISPYKFGCPGFMLKSSISLFNKKPAFLTTTPLPNDPFKVVVIDTAFPSSSTMEK